MTPLCVTATLAGPVALPHGPIAFEALVGAAIVVRDGMVPATMASEIVPLPIPIARHEGGVYLSSVGVYAVEARENRFINRRFPVPEAQAFGDAKLKRIDIAAGAQKSYRLPLETMHLVDDRMTWWCIGDCDEIAGLLTGCIGYLGKRRGVGVGKVARWSVETCEPWSGGIFPIVSSDGQPMRSLPMPWPDLADDVEQAYRTTEPPYWDRSREVLCAVPRWR